ncbi:ubiquitin carboxyl-terminal hydrolase 24-like isoform X1 [Dioscorea cayenensis subsp. rotundata]|uniref:Ubiquitin carboxyl-terminal hydrolase n=1 Tax=Dioscorea cayennensis subsp. rotundata TaxID=55577 RepID=A0AB40CVJ7_DIOCR|nr:ubiquitin carboxyl-terminal hydrolase 24-like isoform X1 [Dioscorea cayenensis subsp. rotundata]
MSDQEVFIFGSFTEEESRFFQNQSAKTNVDQTEKICLRFGSLNFAFENTVKGPSAKADDKADITQACELVAKSSASKNGTGAISKALHKIPQSKINESPNGSLFHNDIIKNEKNTFDISSSSISGSENNTTNLSSFSVAEGQSGDGGLLTRNVQNGDERSCNGNISVSSPEGINNVKLLSKPEKPSEILMPRGLINSGNLCFVNATLQALLSCSQFVHLLHDLRTRNLPKVAYPTLHAFVDFISNFDMPKDWNAEKSKAAVLESGKPFHASMFELVLKKFTPDVPSNLSGGRPRQEDAQEFLSYVMDQMHDELLKLKGPSSHQNGVNCSLVSSDEEDGWETVGRKNRSAVTRTQKFLPSELSAIFGGQLRSVVKARGNRASATVQPFLLLHLDIHPGTVHTIEDALHLFSALETLEGYRISTGKDGEVAASKSVKIQELPRIMILHLMRFSYGSNGMTKLHKPVQFPLELVLGHELLVHPLSEGRRYELVATITHHGREPSRGHYTADTKYSDGQWLRYDDASINAISTSKVLHDEAYVLFYRQI